MDKPNSERCRHTENFFPQLPNEMGSYHEAFIPTVRKPGRFAAADLAYNRQPTHA